MTITASDEGRLWADFQAHVQQCASCADIDRPMCAEGQAFYRSWTLADAIAERRDQEGLDDLTDCADDARPWEL